MKVLKLVVLLAAVIAVGFIGFYSTSIFVNGGMAKESSISQQVQQSTSNKSSTEQMNAKETVNELTKVNSKGAVELKATLVPEKSSNSHLVFEVMMNTHSVNLSQYDFTKLAAISFGTKKNITGTFKWDSSNDESSHHVMGFLVWNGVFENNYKAINLDLKGIDDISSRMFTWEKSNLIDELTNK
jgi:hypothetical protein